MKADEYATRPCYGELVAIILAGSGHVFAETRFSPSIGRLYNMGISLAFTAYLVWRTCRTPGVFRVWGMRCDNFWPALGVQLIFGAVGALALVGFGAATQSLALPGTFWVTVALYPVWGIAQQFALQSLLARNIAGVVSHPVGTAIASSLLFSASHYPRLELVLLTLVAGFFFTLTYRRFPNLWAVGIVHGMLGSLAVYMVLKEDPGAVILDYLSPGRR